MIWLGVLVYLLLAGLAFSVVAVVPSSTPFRRATPPRPGRMN